MERHNDIEAERIRVSDEMTLLVGVGPAPDFPPERPTLLRFRPGSEHAPASFRCEQEPASSNLEADEIGLLVSDTACVRLFGASLPDGAFHLPPELRTIVGALAMPEHEGAARAPYRAAKAIELFCETLRLMRADALVPLRGVIQLSTADSRRLLAARRLIDEKWHEKLTLDLISRACGLNRVKLTKGFREMFDTTIGGAIAERRLEEARRMLRTTDNAISTIGYSTGYTNNASFARAFARRFGLSPSDYRAMKIAA